MYTRILCSSEIVYLQALILTDQGILFCGKQFQSSTKTMLQYVYSHKVKIMYFYEYTYIHKKNMRNISNVIKGGNQY